MKDTNTHNFTGGLNLDDDPRTIPAEDWRSALNIRVDAPGVLLGNSNVVQNVLGNEEVTTIKLLDGSGASPPAGDNTVIGFYEDRNSDSAFYFLYNSNANHCILQYKFADETIYKIVEDPILNFSLSNKITGTSFIDNQLCWGDDLNPYRKLNVVEVANYSTPLIEDHISLIKRPPMYPIDGTRGEDSEEDNLGGKPYWFIYRYLYKDGERSVWSPESKSYSTDFNDFEATYTKVDYNYIDLSVSTGEPTLSSSKYDELIDKIEIAFKDGELNSYKQFKSLDFATTRLLSTWVTFRNKDDSYIVPSSEVDKTVDAVPLYGKALVGIDNRVLLGNYVEGYDSQDLLVNTVFNEAIEQSYVFPQNYEGCLSPNGKYKVGVVFFDDYGRTNGVTTSDDLIFDSSFIAATTGGNHNLYYLNFILQNNAANIPDWASHYRLCITENLKMTSYTWVGQPEKVDGTSLIYFKGRYKDDNGNDVDSDNLIFLKTINDETPIEVLINTTSLIETGTAYNYSEGDRIVWYPPKNSGVFYDLLVLGVEEISGQNYVRAEWDINDEQGVNLIPDPNYDGDPSFSFDAGGAPNGEDWWTSAGQDVELVHVDLTGGAGTITYSTWSYISNSAIEVTFPAPTGGASDLYAVSDVVNYPVAMNRNGVYFFNMTVTTSGEVPDDMCITFYADAGRSDEEITVVFSESDPLLTVGGEEGVDITFNNTYVMFGYIIAPSSFDPSYIGYRVSKLDVSPGATSTIRVSSFKISSGAMISSANYSGSTTPSIAQIYTPRVNTSDDVFYEFGDTYKVIDPYESGRTLEKSIFVSGDYRFQIGDSYYNYYNHTSVSGAFYFSQGSNLTSNLDAPSFGRINADIELKQKRIKTGIRFSDPFIDESNLNGTSTFDSINSKILASELGPIQKLQGAGDVQQEGSVLLSIHEEDTVSIYVGKVEYTDNSGQSNVVTSDKVLGTTRVLQGGYGTLNPESIVQYSSQVYGFDATKGKIWRYGNNGMFPISDIKVASLSNLLGRMTISALGNSGTANILGQYDPLNDEYIISADIDGSTYFTSAYAIALSWSNKRERWVSFWNYTPEWMGRINNILLSFDDGKLYKHGFNSSYGEFYGVNYDASIKTVSNKYPKAIKLWEDLSVEGNVVWYADAITNEPGQSTSTLDSDFEDYEGVFYSYLFRDENTPNVVSPQTPLLHGDEMRSDYIEITWKNEDATQALLRSANVGFFISSGHDNVK